MSEYKTWRREEVQAQVMHQIGEFCGACPEHTREHGDCVDAGTSDALNCQRVQQEVDRMMEA